VTIAGYLGDLDDFRRNIERPESLLNWVVIIDVRTCDTPAWSRDAKACGRQTKDK
jgi:hypothetical protein